MPVPSLTHTQRERERHTERESLNGERKRWIRTTGLNSVGSFRNVPSIYIFVSQRLRQEDCDSWVYYIQGYSVISSPRFITAVLNVKSNVQHNN